MVSKRKIAKKYRSSASLDANFRAHYNAGVEKDRLLSGTSNLEFERTKRILARHLPRRRLTIFDVGGGPGRYSFWLTELGHSVHLVDVLPLHIRQARQFQMMAKNQLSSLRLADARKLDFEDSTADVLLLFGPMYHLVRRSERLRALSEARRVLKPSGLLFAAASSRFTSVLDGSARGFIQDPEFMRIIEHDLQTGQHRNRTNNPAYFTTAYFHHPDELRSEIERAGFTSVKVFAVTGFAWLLPKFNKIWKNKVMKERLMTLLDRTELEPSILGVSDHLLAIGRK